MHMLKIRFYWKSCWTLQRLQIKPRQFSVECLKRISPEHMRKADNEGQGQNKKTIVNDKIIKEDHTRKRIQKYCYSGFRF